MKIETLGSMTEQERRMLITIWGGYQPMHEVMMTLFYLHEHMAYSKRMESFQWLLKNNLVARRFVDFFRNACASSNLELLRYLTKQIELEKGARQIIYGKDFFN